MSVIGNQNQIKTLWQKGPYEKLPAGTDEINKDKVHIGSSSETGENTYLSSTDFIQKVRVETMKETQKIKDCYLPVAEWSGRLILPEKNERKYDGGVYIEIENAPETFSALKGQKIWLSFRGSSDGGERSAMVIRDVKFSSDSEKEIKKGNILPERLNNLSLVSSLESLAGAREDDSVRVMLLDVKVTDDSKTGTVLKIDTEPVMIEGNEMALVKFLSSEGDRGETLKITHYNKNTKDFNGPEEEVYMEEKGSHDHPLITMKNIENSPLNPQGWYIYGHRNEEGKFLINGLEPRELMKVEPQNVRSDLKSSRNYIEKENWLNTPERKGLVENVLLSSSDEKGTNSFKEGEDYLLCHIFGGIGGEGGDKAVAGMTPGHFSFGNAKIVKDPFTGEPKFDITYKQVYGQGPNGVVSASSKWHNYMGSTARGWMYSRPVTDIVVRFPEMNTKFKINGREISFMDILNGEVEKMMARYRIGDGDGVAIISSTNSCVQDSSQSLYAAIYNFKELTQKNPSFMKWVKENPEHRDVIAYKKLSELTSSLEKIVKPAGISRPDWKSYAESGYFTTDTGGVMGVVLKTLLSWKTVMPRYADDKFAEVFLDNGASLWALKAGQIGGEQENRYPTAPTYPFSKQ